MEASYGATKLDFNNSLFRFPETLNGRGLNLVDWKGLEIPSTQRRCKASVKKVERSPSVLAEWIELKETLAKFKLREAMRHQTTRGPMT